MPDLGTLLMIVAGVTCAFAGLYIATWIMRMQVVPPNEMMILSGMTPGGFRQIRGGRAFPLPLVHAKDVLSCEAMPVDIKVQGALSKGEIPLSVDAYANVCIAAHPGLVKSAVRRILRKSEEEILLLAKKTLEGNLREAISSLAPEEVIRDKEEFGRKITEASKDDMGKLGLAITSFVVQTISDDTRAMVEAGGGKEAQAQQQVGYIGLLERTEKARAKAEAIVATFSSKAEATEEVERRRQEAELKRVENEREKFKREREYQVNKMNAEGTVGAEKVRATQRSELSRVQAQIKAREEEIAMLAKKFEAELVKKAEAEAKKMIEDAKGQASQILQAGKAEIDVLDQTMSYIRAAGENGMSNYLVDRLPEVARHLAGTMRSAEAKDIIVMSGSSSGAAGEGGGAGRGSAAGGGGATDALAGLLADPGRLVRFLEQVKAGSNVDLGALAAAGGHAAGLPTAELVTLKEAGTEPDKR